MNFSPLYLWRTCLLYIDRFSIGFVLILSLVFVCNQAIYAQTSRFQFINASLNARMAKVDVYVNGSLAAKSLDAVDATSVLEIATASKFLVSILPADSPAGTPPSASYEFAAESGKGYTLALCDSKPPDTNPFTFILDSEARKSASDASRTDVRVFHTAPLVPAFDVLLRTGPMVLGNLDFGQINPYITFDADDNYLDIKAAGTTDIFATYRLPLKSYKGKVVGVFVLGKKDKPTDLKFYTADEAGDVYLIDYAPIARVQYFNAAVEALDIYKNGTRFSNDANRGGAMPYKYLPASVPIRIAMSPASSISASNPAPYHVVEKNFENLTTCLAVSTGEPGNTAYPLTMMFLDKAREKATSPDSVDVLFFNGAYGVSPLSLRIGTVQNTIPSISYGIFSDYVSLPASATVITLYDAAGNTILASCPIDLTSLKGQSVVLFTSMRPNNPGMFNLYLAQPSGTTQAVCLASSLSDINGAAALRCWPNPASDHLSLTFESKSEDRDLVCRIFDEYGRLMITVPVASGVSGKGMTDIDLSHLSNGFYWVELSGEGGAVLTRTKFIRSH
jgi:hypothetical protein